MSAHAPTCFGDGLDRLARDRGAWPEDAVVYKVEGINSSQILVEGAVPTSLDSKGRPKFVKAKEIFKAVVGLAEYRASFAKTGDA